MNKLLKNLNGCHIKFVKQLDEILRQKFGFKRDQSQKIDLLNCIQEIKTITVNYINKFKHHGINLCIINTMYCSVYVHFNTNDINDYLNINEIPDYYL